MKNKRRLWNFSYSGWFNYCGHFNFRRYFAGLKWRVEGEGGFGMNELLGIAAALLLAAFIIIPGLQTFAGSVMTRMTTWWEGSIITRVFPTGVLWNPFQYLG